MKKTIYIYRLIDANGDDEIVVVSDPADCGVIGGYDKEGNYRQYDSQKMFYIRGWAEKYGMIAQVGSMEIDISEVIFRSI